MSNVMDVGSVVVARRAAKTPPQHEHHELPLLVTVADASRLLKQCRSTIEKLIREHRLEVVRIGRRCMVKRSSVFRLVEGSD